MRIQKILPCLFAMTLGAAGAASSAPLVTNGSFEQSSYAVSSQFGPGFGGQGVTGWIANNGYQIYWFPGTATTVDALSQYSGEAQKLAASFSGASPDGGNFVMLDGDSNFCSQISQTITGLTPGATYNLSFDWAADQMSNRTGATTEQLQASLEAEIHSTSVVLNPNQGFQGWFSENIQFTATGASELLSFLSIGTPQGLPPIALLDGVSLTEVPEPASFALLGLGVAAIGAVAVARRAPGGSALG